MPTYQLTDHESDQHLETLDLVADPKSSDQNWSVTVRRLQGGKRDGVSLVRVDNGRLQFTVVPTRGMGLWKARLGSDTIGWRSPVLDGPVNPSFVDQSANQGLGWLRGFDELMARCGLQSNGPPVYDNSGRLLHGLHGRIANIPAQRVLLDVSETSPTRITLEGTIDETELFFSQLRLRTKMSTEVGSTTLQIHDQVMNLGDRPATFQMLYHWNFGSPYLEAGARLVAPVKTICPRDAASAPGIDHFSVYGSPGSGLAEEVFYLTLHADDQNQTSVLLRNRAGDRGIVLSFNVLQLPCFTQWKCLQGVRDGYVTGLEPGVNYPNTRAFELARDRAPTLSIDCKYDMEVRMQALSNSQEVALVEKAIAKLQSRGTPQVFASPVEPFAPQG
jgi:hypothetical protein